MHFISDGLLSKWGFEDGDILDDLLYDAGYTGADIPHYFDFLSELDKKPWLGFHHTMLALVVVTHVVPKLDQRVDIELIGTIHNPIRACRIDGKAFEDHYNDTAVRLTPATVEVPDEVILAIARNVARDAVTPPENWFA